MARKASQRLKAAINEFLGRLIVPFFKMLRRFDRKRMANIAAGLMRFFGPWLKEQRIGRANLVAAFPEKSPEEIEKILGGVWDNLGRVAAEFSHIDRLHIRNPNQSGPEDIVYSPETEARFLQLQIRKPALLFTAHLANWEIPAYAAAAHDLHLHILYRRPNIAAFDLAIHEVRSDTMGTLVAAGLDAPVRLLRALENGDHVAMLVDQNYGKGVDVMFFGRSCKANPLIAQLARHLECPIHGTRVVRLADQDRFRIDLTEEIPPVRDAEGKVDIQGTMQAITSVIEGWVREHPEQWLWLHRRWRNDPTPKRRLTVRS
jgi:KDO2-lipid IV(A) lauroyltransferase